LYGMLKKRSEDLRVFSLILLAVLFDLGTTTFQTPYALSDVWDEPSDAYTWLKNESGRFAGLPNYRVLFTSKGEYGLTLRFPAISPLETGMPTVAGGYGQGAPLSYDFGLALMQSLNTRFSENRVELPSQMSDALYLFNTRYVVAKAHEGQVTYNKDQFSDVKVFQNGVTLWEIRECSPIVVSRKVAPYESDRDPTRDRKVELTRIIEKMRIDARNDTCDVIPIREHLSLLEGAIEDHDLLGVEVVEHNVENQKVELVVNASSDCFAQLSYSYYPFLKIRVDGKETACFRTALHLTGVHLSKGTHRIVMTPVLSRLRKYLLIAGLFTLGVMISLILLRSGKGILTLLHINRGASK
ncbi:MAG: hypothetical protein HY709_12280, partial [Candidatus Latescibacteria bacterium]|nr:hypothetical protein [Candidatus Latescibacterota bacterium]